MSEQLNGVTLEGDGLRCRLTFSDGSALYMSLDFNFDGSRQGLSERSMAKRFARHLSVNSEKTATEEDFAVVKRAAEITLDAVKEDATVKVICGQPFLVRKSPRENSPDGA